MKAQFYTYRNLNFGQHFSIKHNGRVINYLESGHIQNGRFQVSEASRQRCLREKKRNVHAFIVSEKEPTQLQYPPLENVSEVSYNPHRGGTFFLKSDGSIVTFATDIYLLNGRAYVGRAYIISPTKL